MSGREDNLWARREHRRHAELYEAEYAKQLERIARIRQEVSAGLPDAGLPDAPPPKPVPAPAPAPHREPARSTWDTTPPNLAPVDGCPGAAPAPHVVGGPTRCAGAPRHQDIVGAPAQDPIAAAEPTVEVHGVAPVPEGPQSRHVAPFSDAAEAAERPPAVTGVAPLTSAAEPASSRAGVNGIARHVRAAQPPRSRATVNGVARRRGDDTAPPRDVAAPLRRSWIAIVAVAALAVGAGAAVLATRPAEAPAEAVFRVPSQPTGLVAADGRVWVAGPAAGTVWVLDANSGRPAGPALRTGGTPARIALDQRFAWIADTQRGGLIRIPRAGDGKPRWMQTGPDVADVAVAGGAVWTASSADGTVRVLDEQGHKTTLQVGARPIALAANDRRVVAADSAGMLIRIDTRLRRPQGPPIPLGGAPVDVALTGDRAWVADANAGTVRPVDLASGRVGKPIGVCSSPAAIAADAAAVYVACRGDRLLVSVDPSTGDVRSQVRLKQTPTALALDPRHVWVAAGTHEVIRVDR